MQNRTKVKAVYAKLRKAYGVRLVEARELARALFMPIESVQYALRYLSDLGAAEFQGLGWQLTKSGAETRWDWNRPNGWNRDAILQYLTKHGPTRAPDIAKACDISHQNVNKYGRMMAEAGEIVIEETRAPTGHKSYIYRVP